MEFIFDFSMLLGKIRECGLTQEQLAKKVGMAPSNLNLKLHNKLDFKCREVENIILALGIDEEQINEYFFVLK